MFLDVVAVKKINIYGEIYCKERYLMKFYRIFNKNLNFLIFTYSISNKKFV